MEGSSTTITTTASTSDQSNKENVPPVCNGNKGKIPISQKGPSFKNKNKNKKNKRSKRKPKSKRVPLADITALFNNSATTTTTTTATSTLPHQPQIEVSAVPPDPSISRRKTVTPASKTLRMGFR